MNQYGVMARDHWAKYRPSEFRQIPDPEEYFGKLGERMGEEILALQWQLAGDDPPGEGYLEKVGRLNAARLQAEEQVLRETLPSAEDED